MRGSADADIDRGWKRLCQTFTIDTSQTVTIYGGIFDATGAAWFDCFKLEEGEQANCFNMVNSSKFDTVNMLGWSKQNFESGDIQVTDSTMGSCVKITGNPGLEKRMIQCVYTNGPEGDVYRFGGFVKADAIPGKTFRIAAAVIYSDGTHKFENVDIDPYRSGWQYVSGIVNTSDENSTTEKTYTAIHLYIYYENQLNPAYFTSMQVVKDDTESYTYDRNGNLNTAKKTQENNAFQYDGNSLLRRFSSLDGSAYDTYYNDKRMPQYAKSAEGIRSFFWYNTKGQPTTMSLEADKNSRAVTVGRIYYIVYSHILPGHVESQTNSLPEFAT